MRVLVVNAGSSSLKLRFLDEHDESLAGAVLEGWGGPDDLEALEEFCSRLDGVAAVGHRVVHGGSDLRRAVVVDDVVEARIEELAPLAPLHQVRALVALRAVRALLPDAPAMACFDTAFHSSLSQAAATYALPRNWIDRWSLRRYGFHGLSHAYAARRVEEWTGPSAGPRRVVSCHLGSGASLCAVLEGRSVDTTMGFTPLEGLVMATRSGSVDPGLLLWLLESAGLSTGEVARALEEASGLAGLAGGTGDMREVLAAAGRGDPPSCLALDVYVHRLRREIGSMVAVLGGIDALVFTGGVGEHLPAIRAAATAALDFAGVVLDPQANKETLGDGEIGAPGARARTFVVTSREDLEMAREVRQALSGTGAASKGDRGRE